MPPIYFLEEIPEKLLRIDQRASVEASAFDRSATVCIGAYVYGKPYQDHYVYELLRVTEEGQPVLDCVGGACSRHAAWDGPLAHPGEKVVLLNWDEAYLWIERHLNGDEYCKAMDTMEFFGY